MKKKKKNISTKPDKIAEELKRDPCVSSVKKMGWNIIEIRENGNIIPIGENSVYLVKYKNDNSKPQ